MNQNNESPAIQEPVPEPEIKLEDLPYHELKRVCSEKHPDIKVKNSWNKKELIKVITTGKTAEKVKEVKRAPIMPEPKAPVKAIVPKDIEEDLERLKERGLTWHVTEEDGCINFANGIYTACANLDQPSKNILLTAMTVFPKSAPVEMSRGEKHRHLD